MKSKTTYTLFQETTVWAAEGIPNHIYVFDGKPKARVAKAIGYIRRGTDKFHVFQSPMQIDMRGREFKDVSNNKWSI